MKAAVYRTYGAPSVVTIADVPKPTPKDNEVLIRIHATTVTTGDWRARSLDMPAGFSLFARPVFGFFGPRQPILGTELAGVIEAVGKTVTRFKVGRRRDRLPERQVRLSRRVSHDAGGRADRPQAGEPVVRGGRVAVVRRHHGAAAAHDKAGIKAGDKVLVVGASGGVGSSAVQIAKHFGAEVTGVTSTTNVELVRSIGADRVIDYTREDFAKTGETYDIIFDTTGTAPYARVADALKAGGRLVVVLGTLATMLGIGRPPKSSGKRVIAEVVSITPDHMQYLAAAGGER